MNRREFIAGLGAPRCLKNRHNTVKIVPYFRSQPQAQHNAGSQREQQKKGRKRCQRPKSREETPKEGCGAPERHRTRKLFRIALRLKGQIVAAARPQRPAPPKP
jgi:hypothetical protein